MKMSTQYETLEDLLAAHATKWDLARFDYELRVHGRKFMVDWSLLVFDLAEYRACLENNHDFDFELWFHGRLVMTGKYFDPQPPLSEFAGHDDELTALMVDRYFANSLFAREV
jgi:hypothetical protein